MIIYKAVNNVNSKVYIGKTIQTLNCRISHHKCTAKNDDDNNYFHNALIKHGVDNFYWVVLNKCYDIETLDQLEQYYISFYESEDKENGYNLTAGGGGNIGYKQSSETIAKRIANRPNVKGYRNPMYGLYGENNPNYGSKRTKEQKNNISKNHAIMCGKLNPMWGRKHSKVTKEKQRQARLKYLREKKT